MATISKIKYDPSQCVELNYDIASSSTVQDLEFKIKNRFIHIEKVLRRERWVKRTKKR